jgi:hypothetical protein
VKAEKMARVMRALIETEDMVMGCGLGSGWVSKVECETSFEAGGSKSSARGGKQREDILIGKKFETSTVNGS